MCVPYKLVCRQARQHVAAIDQHGDRQALDAATLKDFRFGDARDFVIDDFFGFFAGVLVFVATAIGRIGTRKFGSS